ncbi:MAG: hypothetical protein HYZ90_05035 [Candidatus Omnitrophica bacterium]|nr:hypothetical protein [Candidatus Omnitrophota bacterium]
MSFAEIAGLRGPIRLLEGQLKRGKLASTYLLTGMRGIGKRTLALELAKALECAFPDLIEVKPDSESGQIRIDQIRALAGGMNLTPLRGQWKIGLIDEADSMTEEASHACLRLLEEPPERSILILIAARPHRLPATAVSRCHLVRCFPQGIEEVKRFLQSREKLDSASASIAATLSGGRLGVALNLHRKEQLSAKNACLDQLLSAWRQRRLEIPLGTAPRAEVEQALEWLAAWWRDLVLLKLQADSSWLIHRDRAEDLRRELGALRGGVESLLSRIERTYLAQEAVQRNASPRIALAAVLSQGERG